MADNKDDDAPSVPIPISTGDVVTGNDMRGNVKIPFTAYYQEGTIYISTSAEFLSIAVDVVNGTTGQIWTTTTDISDGMGEIYITGGGEGSYSVEIVTEYGDFLELGAVNRLMVKSSFVVEKGARLEIENVVYDVEEGIFERQ